MLKRRVAIYVPDFMLKPEVVEYLSVSLIRCDSNSEGFRCVREASTGCGLNVGPGATAFYKSRVVLRLVPSSCGWEDSTLVLGC